MGFYQELSKYYDLIFTLSQDKLDFMDSRVGADSKILDVACGTGSYTIALADLGHEVDGIDLDREMLNRAQEKLQDKEVEINFIKGDIKEINKLFNAKAYDLVFSLGNSLVHLDSQNEIKEAIQDFYTLLNNEGKIILQIINYDRILDQSIDHLPTIEADEGRVKFIRRYQQNKSRNKIDFNTKLIINKGIKEMVYENWVPLVPLRVSTLKEFLIAAGFKKIEFYGDFKGTTYSKSSYATIAYAEK